MAIRTSPTVGRRRHRAAWAVAAAIAMGAACGTDPTTPTSPSENAPPIWAVLSCAPPAGVPLHRVDVPGTAGPTVLWVEGTVPGTGATIRPGERYEVRYRYTAPPAHTVQTQIQVGVSPAPLAFRGSTLGGCGGGSTFGSIPSGGEPLHIFVRVWVEPREVPVAEQGRVFDRPPDYEASEPVPWTVVP